jgi:predicted Rdx family selenoprotein
LENIERTQFVVLTGHLDEQSLPDLIRTLRVQRKSGRLQVEYPDTPGLFFFEDGQLVDAQLGTLRGVEALYVALALQGAAYNFNPLVRPPERSIAKQEQKFIWDMIEAPRREGLSEISVAGAVSTPPAHPALTPPTESAPLQLAPVPAEFMAPLVARLDAVEAAIVSTARRFSRERLLYTLIISFLVGLILVTLLQVAFGPFLAAPASATTPGNREQERAASVEPPARTAPAQAADTTTTAAPAAQQVQQTLAADLTTVREVPKTGDVAATRTEYVVRIRMRVKNGQVTGARVLNSRSATSAYEALALKLAMQHHYPEDFTGGDTLKFIVER